MPLEIVNETETETENDATNSKLRLGYRRGLQHQFGCRFEMKNAQKPTRRSKIRKKRRQNPAKTKETLGLVILSLSFVFFGGLLFFLGFFVLFRFLPGLSNAIQAPMWMAQYLNCT